MQETQTTIPWKPSRQASTGGRKARRSGMFAAHLMVLFLRDKFRPYTAAVVITSRARKQVLARLFRSGFTDRQLSPFDEEELVEVWLRNHQRRASRHSEWRFLTKGS